jgi:hypothetical protein
MTHALLVSGQHVDESFLSSNSSTFSARYGCSLIDEQRSQDWSEQPVAGFSWRVTPFNFPLSLERAGSETTGGSSPIVAQRVLEQLAALRSDRQMYQKTKEEMEWVAENRARFNGRWIALAGRELLAVGDSAREVFRATEHMVPPPLVIKIEEESLPFSGW